MRRNLISRVLLSGAALIMIIAYAKLFVEGNTILHPQNDTEFARATVAITLDNEKSGGTGVILKSSAAGSEILTNKHVCQLIQAGGLVKSYDGSKSQIQQFKPFPGHDLCLVKVAANLGVNTQVAPSSPLNFQGESVSGHPMLLPTIVQHGHFSEHLPIDVVVGTQPCDGTETGDDIQSCVFFGKRLTVKHYEAQVISSTIMPGSSGSAVYNTSGEIGGLVFAGPGEGLGFGFIVPYSYVVDFLHQADKLQWQNTNPNAPEKNLFDSILKIRARCQEEVSLRGVCRKFGFNAIMLKGH